MDDFVNFILPAIYQPHMRLIICGMVNDDMFFWFFSDYFSVFCLIFLFYWLETWSITAIITLQNLLKIALAVSEEKCYKEIQSKALWKLCSNDGDLDGSREQLKASLKSYLDTKIFWATNYFQSFISFQVNKYIYDFVGSNTYKYLCTRDLNASKEKNTMLVKRCDICMFILSFSCNKNSEVTLGGHVRV